MADNKKSKNKEVEVELPKNPNEYSYRGQEDVVVPAHVFLAMNKAINTVLEKGTTTTFPEVVKWVSIATGTEVANPSAEEKQQGLVAPTVDIKATFEPSNSKVAFEPWLYPDIVGLKDALLFVHTTNVKSGVAVPIEELIAEAKAKQAPQSKALADVAEAQKDEAPGKDEDTSENEKVEKKSK
jgi:hypothetical protein